MAAGRELFKLFGMIGLQGTEQVTKSLSKIDKQTKRVQREIDKMGRKVSKVGKTLTKAFTLPLIAASAATVKFIEKGADLNETISKVNELFGQSSVEIQKWAGTAAVSIGQSKQQAMDAASTFAIFGRSAGLAGKDLVEFAKENTSLASDMASFFNTKPEDAIQAIGAAYRGETEPIRRYGVMLDDATMRQKAFELGLVTTIKKALLPQTKVLAAQALIFEKTKAAQGDFARTSDQLANKQRILSARFENVSAALGTLFLPLALKVVNITGILVDKVESVVVWWTNLNVATKTTIKGFVLLVGAIGPVTFAIGKLIILFKILIPLFVAIKTGGIAQYFATLSKSAAATALAIGALVAVGWYYFSQWETISKQLAAIWERMKLAVLKLGRFILDTLASSIDSVLKVVDKLSFAFPSLGKKIKSARIDVLRFRAALAKTALAQQQSTAATIEQAEATDGFLKSVKKSIEAAKEKLGFIKEETEATKDKTQIEKELEEERKRAAEEEVEKTKKLAEEKAAFEKSIMDQANNLRLSEKELLAVERDEQLAEAKRLGADIFAVKQLYSLKAIELEKRETQAKKREVRKGLNMVGSIGGRINNILSKFSQAKITRINIEEKRQIEAVNNSTASEEEKAQAISAIQKRMEKRKLAAERRAMIREKASALFSIAVNTARAVVEALPNIPLSIGMGLIGAAEAGAVLSQPQPFFDGALIQGSEKGITAQAGERNQDEVIFPLERGIGMIVEGLLDRLSNLEFPSFGVPDVPISAAGGAGAVSEMHLHIGTLIADEQGLTMLERKLNNIRISENQRKGVI